MMDVIQRFRERYEVVRDTVDLHQLQQVSLAYANLPYENVTKILKEVRSAGSEMKLRAPGEVLEDHLRWGTGGTCFSLCNTLREMLKQSQFDCWIAMGDMHYGENIHCAVVVRLGEDQYLLDPGYLLHDPVPLPGGYGGPPSPNQPRAGLEIRHQTRMNTIVLRSEEEGIISLYTLESGQLKWRYRLRIREVPEEEFVRHWIHSFSLNTMENVMLSRLDVSGRLYFRKDRLERVRPDHRERKKVTPGDSAVLAAIFGVPADLILQAQKALDARR